MFEQRPWKYIDWGLVGLTLILGILGLIILYSAVTAGASAPQKSLCEKQMIWFCVGLTAMSVFSLFNYKMLDQWGPGIYLIAIALLVCVLLFGKHVSGSRRWLTMGPLTIQPSEIVKIAVIIILARYYAKRANTKGFTIKELIIPTILVMIPFTLIVKQPDLGTAGLVLLTAASMTVFVKIERRSFMYIIGGCLVTIPLIWSFLLKGYQKQRVLTFLNPDRDPLGAGYHIIQSKIAIGSGMLLGKGFLKGTQNALSFLPEQHTDFILSVLAEEWGFVGVGLILLVYLLMIAWGLNIAHRCRDPFGTILSVGITAMIFWQVFINVGMVMGLFPVVGVPLPLISYGGSSVVTCLAGIGILMGVSVRRHILE
jgi:rod shape determining protein RodA